MRRTDIEIAARKNHVMKNLEKCKEILAKAEATGDEFAVIREKSRLAIIAAQTRILGWFEGGEW